MLDSPNWLEYRTIVITSHGRWTPLTVVIGRCGHLTPLAVVMRRHGKGTVLIVGDRKQFSSEFNDDDWSDVVHQGVHVSQNIGPKECDQSSSFSHPSSTPRRLSAPQHGFYHNT